MDAFKQKSELNEFFLEQGEEFISDVYLVHAKFMSFLLFIPLLNIRFGKSNTILFTSKRIVMGDKRSSVLLQSYWYKGAARKWFYRFFVTDVKIRPEHIIIKIRNLFIRTTIEVNIEPDELQLFKYFIEERRQLDERA